MPGATMQVCLLVRRLCNPQLCTTALPCQTWISASCRAFDQGVQQVVEIISPGALEVRRVRILQASQ
jgi:hypothetical protein